MKKYQVVSKETDAIAMTVECEKADDAFLAYARYAGVPLSVAYRYFDVREVA